MGLRNSRAIVLGNGFIGSAIAAAMTEEFASVDVVARRSRPLDNQLAALGVRVHYCDDPADYWQQTAVLARESDVLVSAIGSSSPSLVQLHFRASLQHALCAAAHVMKIHTQTTDLRVIHISSGGTIYGESPLTGSLEFDLTQPSGNYGLMHSRVEEELLSHSMKDGTDLIVARVANPFGPDQTFTFGQGFVALAAERIRTGLPVTLVDGGEQVRDFVHIDDVGRSISALATSPTAKGIYNIGTSTGTSARRMGELIASTLGRETSFMTVPGRPFDVQQNILNNQRITSETGIEFMPLEQGLQRVLCQLATGTRGMSVK